MSYNTLNIEIFRPYSSLKDRTVKIEDIISLNLNEATCEELHRQLDEELYFRETRENLLEKIEELESELRDYKGA
jgi:hypothetical protein